MLKHLMPHLACSEMPAGMIQASSVPTPRALDEGRRFLGAIRAQGAGGGGEENLTTETLRNLTASIERFRDTFEGRLAAVEAAGDQNATRGAADLLGTGTEGVLAVDTDYTNAFASYTRRGAMEAEASLRTANAEGERRAIQAAFTEGDASTGGYLAPVEWDRNIQKAQRALSPMRRLASVVTTRQAAYSTLWTNDMWGSGWVGEAAARPTTTTATFAPLVIPAGEIYAMPAATQRLLDDAAINFDTWLATALSDEFSRQEGVAFISGDGVNKPMGLLQYAPGGAATGSSAHPGGTMSITKSGTAAAVDRTDALIDLKYGLAAPYRQNATWLMNSQTAAAIAKLKDGQGNYIWREALLASEPATLLGRPVEIDENMPNIAAGALPIAFGDFSRGYLVNDRVGVRILRDPYTNKPFIMFYSTKRVGGGLLDPNAIRLMQVAA